MAGEEGRVVLLTGGAGYIGTHCIVSLVEAGYSPVIVDNMHNTTPAVDWFPLFDLGSIKAVEAIVKCKIPSYNIDILNKAALSEVFGKHKVFAVIHMASLKAVGESCEKPLDYYRVNVGGSVALLEVMKEHNVKNIVMSSSATVYGTPQYLPIDEKHPVGGCTNPYGKSKLFIEEILKDLHTSDNSWNIIILRYFNPIGSHESGTMGENPKGIPNNLSPFIAQVAVGKRAELNIFGDDYDTVDGTGVRDYIHIMDLAAGHCAAINKFKDNPGCKAYNLGTGNGFSVLEMVKAFEKASGKPVPYKICPRRPGDIAAGYADPKLAGEELNWKATRGIDEMCVDLWRWQSMNPDGYTD